MAVSRSWRPDSADCAAEADALSPALQAASPHLKVADLVKAGASCEDASNIAVLSWSTMTYMEAPDNLLCGHMSPPSEQLLQLKE